MAQLQPQTPAISQLENHQPGPGPGAQQPPPPPSTYAVYPAANPQLVQRPLQMTTAGSTRTSPPPYDQAMLHQQQPTLQKQVQAASEVVHTLSQLNSSVTTAYQTQLLEQQLRRGDYHVASFTKPIPTSSYIHALPEGSTVFS